MSLWNPALAAAATIALCTSASLGQTVAWTARTYSGPPARYGHSMAYDSGRHMTVLFGGYIDGVRAGDTWEWDGAAWTQRQTTGPSARVAAAMAYDSTRGVTVLFGGAAGAGLASAETWEWNGTAWARRLVSGPSARYGHAMTYDPVRSVTVLFGGSYRLSSSEPAVFLSDTWEWDGSAWTNVQPTSAAPSVRSNASLSFDAGRGRMVLFGGYASGVFPADFETWELNGSDWALRGGSPSLRRAAFGMAYAGRGRTIAFGGDNGTAASGASTPYTASNQTLAWNGSSWTILGVAGPPARMFNAMVFDSVRRKTVLFGGVSSDLSIRYGDTWELSDVCPGDFNDSGGLEVQDIFDFLNAWLSADPRADFNGVNGISTQDIFDFLNAWLAGC